MSPLIAPLRRPPGAPASAPTTSSPPASARRPRAATSTPRSAGSSSPTLAGPTTRSSTHLLPLARPDDTWLDIGAGAGRYALPLALRVREVVALDPSPGMLAALREQATEHGIANVRAIEGRWPVDPALGPAPTADVALIANLGYDVEAIGPFLDAMEAAAGRLCVAILADRQPSAPAHAFWPPVHGEARIELPALDDFLDLLRARGRDPAGRPRRAAGPRLPDPGRAGPLAAEPALPRAGEREGRAAGARDRSPAGRATRTAASASPRRWSVSTGLVTWEPR